MHVPLMLKVAFKVWLLYYCTHEDCNSNSSGIFSKPQEEKQISASLWLIFFHHFLRCDHCFLENTHTMLHTYTSGQKSCGLVWEAVLQIVDLNLEVRIREGRVKNLTFDYSYLLCASSTQFNVCIESLLLTGHELRDKQKCENGEWVWWLNKSGSICPSLFNYSKD